MPTPAKLLRTLPTQVWQTMKCFFSFLFLSPSFLARAREFCACHGVLINFWWKRKGGAAGKGVKIKACYIKAKQFLEGHELRLASASRRNNVLAVSGANRQSRARLEGLPGRESTLGSVRASHEPLWSRPRRRGCRSSGPSIVRGPVLWSLLLSASTGRRWKGEEGGGSFLITQHSTQHAIARACGG